MNYWRFKSCSRCNGDLILEDSEWRCLQCGHYYYPNVPQFTEPSLEEALPSRGIPVQRERARGYAGEDANSLARMDKWRSHNGQIISYLDEGLTIPEISLLTGSDKRHIRGVRERLADLGYQSEEAPTPTSAVTS